MNAQTEDVAVAWITGGPSWLAYRALVDLLNIPETDPRVQAARQSLVSDSRIQTLIAELASWPGAVLKSHNDASHLLHKLVFLAELGLRADDPGIGTAIDRIFAQRSPDGIFQIVMNIKPAYGGTGEDQSVWMLCDAPLITYALLKLGLQHDNKVMEAAQFLVGLGSQNGWPCTVSAELGKFRGPGRKEDPCPFATLAMLKLYTQLPDSTTEPARIGAETLLSLWQQRKKRRPYLFAMGTGFSKLKAPLIWYDILNVVDVLTNFPWLKHEPRLHEMMELISSKADTYGRFSAESIWTAWKDWEFGQKREPSRWITLIARRAFQRVAAPG